ncbi:hypothetical protein N0V82_002584 [Gnomoniopsis sp. IMI 355080]|nr:hypothetical protein N0V82_002584 [Gnomoniopsis sp. IMI 355080]
MASPASASVLRRALLYVPASSSRFLTKSLSLTSDNVTYDLEDSVTPSEKPNARAALASHLGSLSARPETIAELAARINAPSTPYALADLQALGALPALDAIVIPKVNTASDLTFVADVLKHVAPERYQPGAASSRPIQLLALIESATAILNLEAICRAGTRDNVHLSGLIFAAEDFSHDLSLTRTPSLKEFLYARSAIATHARAFDLPSTIDLVCTTFRGKEGEARLAAECEDGRGMGFNGKQCIHPSQVKEVQRAFAPGEAEVEWSVRVVIADEKAASGERRGAWTLEGKMIDVPVVRKAKAVVDRAARCGFDVEGMREKWKGQEPE